MSFCPSNGNLGFPVNVTGSRPIDSTKEVPNDFQSRFSPTQVRGRYDKTTGRLTIDQGSHSFFLGGTSYNFSTARICRASHRWVVPQQAVFYEYELQIWGNYMPSNSARSSVAVLILPLTVGPEEKTASARAAQSWILGNEFLANNLFPSAQVLRYETCIELEDNTTYNLNVGAWSVPLGIAREIFDEVLNRNVPSGIPIEMMGSRRAYGSRDDRLTTPQLGGLNRNETFGITQSYTKSVPVAPVGQVNADYTMRFRKISYTATEQSVRKARSTSTDAYKCVAIDRARDIQKGHLVVDPTTGRKLTQVQDEETQQLLQLDEEPEVNPGNTEQIILWIAVGITCLAIAAGLFSIARFVYGPYLGATLGATQESVKQVASQVGLPKPTVQGAMQFGGLSVFLGFIVTMVLMAVGVIKVSSQ